MGRLGKPEDVASIVRYLAGRAHMFMTGQHFVVTDFQWSCLSCHRRAAAGHRREYGFRWFVMSGNFASVQQQKSLPPESSIGRRSLSVTAKPQVP